MNYCQWYSKAVFEILWLFSRPLLSKAGGGGAGGIGDGYGSGSDTRESGGGEKTFVHQFGGACQHNDWNETGGTAAHVECDG